MKLVTSQQMQEIDRTTIDGGHVPSLTLMEHAGRAVAVAAQEMLRGVASPHVEIVCGKGNNGGDGLVAARHLAAAGLRVHVWLTHPIASLSPDARHNAERLTGSAVRWDVLPDTLADPGSVDDERALGVARAAVRSAPLDASTAVWIASLQRCDLCIDALLGTGVQKDLTGRVAALVNTMNRSACRVLAADIPSGVDGTTAAVHGTAIWAERTVTMGLPKHGLVFPPGAQRTGQLVVADIGFPADIVDAVDTPWSWTNREAVRRDLPVVSATAHKYARGALLVVAGSRAYPGAAALAAEAGLRTGAGIVHLVVPESIRDLLNSQLREVIVHGAPETAAGFLHADARDLVDRLLPRMQAVALGPGMGDAVEAQECAARILEKCTVPHVVDADALQVVPRAPRSDLRVVTPHVGELARMLGRSTADVAGHRVAAAEELARQVGCVVLCKGAPTVVLLPDGTRRVNGTGNPGLATAGSGDVLTGIVGGLLAQGAPPAAAGSMAAWLHGRAAERASTGRAARSLVAGDLLAHLGPVLGELTTT